MCGIAGIISPDSSLVSINKLKQMTNATAHRGPNGEGQWISPKSNVGLAHRRLSIIDLSNAAAQPMHYLQRYSITFNGEIYNYVEIKEVLQKRGYQFDSTSDTEVILAAFDCWKADCLQHFDGMFAFAVWDEKEQQLFCARDRFGEKPFYFFKDAKQFVFASEMKALWAIGIQKYPDNCMLLNYLTIGYTNNPTNAKQTFYQQINTLPAGHFLWVNLQDLLKTERWYNPVFNTFNGTSENAIEQFSFLFQQSVARRLRSDVAVGTSLSGGLDSSSIVAQINSCLVKSPLIHQMCFSAIFPGFAKDESKYMDEVVRQFKITHFTTTPTATGFETSLKQLMWHQEEPLQSASVFAQWEVYRLAKSQHVTVLLDGQGADETLAGYQKYYQWYWQQLLAKGQKNMLANERKMTAGLGIDVPWGIKNMLAAKLPKFASAKLSKNAIKQQRKQPFVTSAFLNGFLQKDILHKPVISELNDILKYDTFTRGLGDLLRYADRNSMAHGCEVRLPFLNHELVEFVFSLPADMKINGGWTKWILRKSMAARLPANIAWRKDKVGYEPPQQQWLQQPAIVEQIMESRKKLVAEKVLKKKVLASPIIASSAHAGNNFDWRCLCVTSI